MRVAGAVKWTSAGQLGSAILFVIFITAVRRGRF